MFLSSGASCACGFVSVASLGENSELNRLSDSTTPLSEPFWEGQELEVVLQISDRLLLEWKELFLCVGVRGLAGTMSEAISSVITVTPESSSVCSAGARLSALCVPGSSSGDNCSSQMTFSPSGINGWLEVMSDTFLDSGLVSPEAFLTTEI